MAGGSNGYRAALGRRQLTPGLISSLPGTAGSPPFIFFSTSYKEESFTMNANEAAVRNAYQVAEHKDYAGWVNCFTEDGTFTDESIGATYRGKELNRPVEIYAAPFPEMHRELNRIFVDANT